MFPYQNSGLFEVVECKKTGTSHRNSLKRST